MTQKRAKLKEIQRNLARETARANELAKAIWLSANTSARRDRLSRAIQEQRRLVALLDVLS